MPVSELIEITRKGITMSGIRLFISADARVEGLAKWLFANQHNVAPLVATCIGDEFDPTRVSLGYLVGEGIVRHNNCTLDIGFTVGPVGFECRTDPQGVIVNLTDLIATNLSLCEITTNWGVIFRTIEGTEIFGRYVSKK